MKTAQDYIIAFSKYCSGAARTKQEKELLEMRKSQIGENQYKLPKDKKQRAKKLQQIQDRERRQRCDKLQKEID